MSDDWAKEIAEKIKATSTDKALDKKSALIAKFADDARSQAADVLFSIFTRKIDAICSQIEKSEGKKGFFSFFRKSSPSIIDYDVESDLTFRFQMRESFGNRLKVQYNRGSIPLLKIDVATHELIEGSFLPIFRDSGAIAGAQIWQEKQSENKHPELIARLFLILSSAAVEENFKVKDAVSWVFEENSKRFTEESAETIIEKLIASA